MCQSSLMLMAMHWQNSKRTTPLGMHFLLGFQIDSCLMLTIFPPVNQALKRPLFSRACKITTSISPTRLASSTRANVHRWHSLRNGAVSLFINSSACNACCTTVLSAGSSCSTLNCPLRSRKGKKRKKIDERRLAQSKCYLCSSGSPGRQRRHMSGTLWFQREGCGREGNVRHDASEIPQSAGGDMCWGSWEDGRESCRCRRRRSVGIGCAPGWDRTLAEHGAAN